MALALIAVLAITAFAAASTVKRFDSKVTLAASDPCPRQGRPPASTLCEVQRKVKVFNVRAGPDGLSEPTKTNNPAGVVHDAERQVLARVTRRGGSRDDLVCRPDRSRTRHFGSRPLTRRCARYCAAVSQENVEIVKRGYEASNQTGELSPECSRTSCST